MPSVARYDVVMDGACSFCRWSRKVIEPFDPDARLRFLDYNDPAVATQVPFPSSELDRELHVRTPAGAWLLGFNAWLAIMRALPKLAWIGRVAELPPLRWFGPIVYRFIARHRYWLPGAPKRCETDTCARPARGSD